MRRRSSSGARDDDGFCCLFDRIIMFMMNYLLCRGICLCLKDKARRVSILQPHFLSLHHIFFFSIDFISPIDNHMIINRIFRFFDIE